MKRNNNLTKKITESSLMVAFATVLSFIKLVEMPYGGSVTLASMLPIVIVSYRHGIIFGLASGGVYAAIQQLLGLSTLSYFTTWQSILAVILLDYVIAFTITGLGGIFRSRLGLGSLSSSKRAGVEFAVGMVFVCLLRYVCHTVAGATVWAGLSIPTEAALIYSVSYNATYMLPETVIASLVAFWIGSEIDFSKSLPTRYPPSQESGADTASVVLPKISMLLIVLCVVFDTIMIAPYLQNAETGEFTFASLGDVAWVAVIIVSIILIVAAVIMAIVARIRAKSQA